MRISLFASRSTVADADAAPSFFGRPELLDLWPQMLKSPVMTHFAWSAPVLDAVARNMRLISPSSPASSWRGGGAPDKYGVSRAAPAIGIQRLVAVHIRRGDFEDHCRKLHGWGAGFASWNLLKGLPDTFSPSKASPADYEQKCWPDIEQIVDRLHEVRAQHDKREGAGHELENIFIMTNGKRQWVTDLKIALHNDGWRTVSSSKDLVLDPVEDSVNQAIDMEIARRAEVFVGNGVSDRSHAEALRNALTPRAVLHTECVGHCPATDERVDARERAFFVIIAVVLSLLFSSWYRLCLDLFA